MRTTKQTIAPTNHHRHHHEQRQQLAPTHHRRHHHNFINAAAAGPPKVQTFVHRRTTFPRSSAPASMRQATARPRCRRRAFTCAATTVVASLPPVSFLPPTHLQPSPHAATTSRSRTGQICRWEPPQAARVRPWPPPTQQPKLRTDPASRTPDPASPGHPRRHGRQARHGRLAPFPRPGRAPAAEQGKEAPPPLSWGSARVSGRPLRRRRGERRGGKGVSVVERSPPESPEAGATRGRKEKGFPGA
ncbi:unnamed protein product [Urochloa humidicola]